MTIADIPSGMRLKEEAGWNQVEADWQRLIELQPDGGFVAELDGRTVGTVTSCRFGCVAWVAMMLVEQAHRGRGIGRALMVRVLNELDGQRVASVRLDATPLGRPLYETLGFREESTFERYQGCFPQGEPTTLSDSVLPATSLEGVLELDRRVTGTERGGLLRRLLDDNPGSLRIVSSGAEVQGYLMSRPGSRAMQLGPCIASEAAGPLLLSDAARRNAGASVVIDIPEGHRAARALAESLGLSRARQLIRMGRGRRVAEDLSRLWASAGPEKG
jgi:GNAT superfamily N-acetyltransferase